MPASPTRHIKQLERRLAFLEKRVEEYRGHSPSYDRAEIAALRWAIPILQDAVDGFSVTNEGSLAEIFANQEPRM